MQRQQEKAGDAVIPAHFDLPVALLALDVKIEPAGGASAPHYVPASEDLSRPGAVWYPVAGRSFFPLFGEITTSNHEGYPGHHLQFAAQITQADNLSRYQRLASWNPGSGEGWALYAEQLMDELGELDRPAYRVGLLSSQIFRARRFAIDIGIHHRLGVPADATFHPGNPGPPIWPWSYWSTGPSDRGQSPARFDLKALHARVLAPGSIGLDALRGQVRMG